MSNPQREPVVLDTSVLINFLAIDRVDLLAHHPRYRFVLTEHVRKEVTAHYQDQWSILETALQQGALVETRVESMAEIALFAQLTKNPRLGLGECAAVAAAVTRTQPLAIDDKAARKAALDIAPGLSLINTQSLVLSLICANTLTVEQADAIKTTWEKEYSFRLKIGSFKELL
jgi:predicted nucleic acid-binding protein